MSKLIEELREQIRMSEYSGTIHLHQGEAKELLAHIERLEAQLAEAKGMYICLRTEMIYPHELRLRTCREVEELFDRQMHETAQQIDWARESKGGA